MRSAKLPELMAEQEDDRAAERLWLAEQLGRLIEALTASFLEERRGPGWTKTVAAMKKWMAAQAPPVPEIGT